MTTAAYNIAKKALLKKTAEVKASPAAARKLLVSSGLWDLLDDVPPTKRAKAAKALIARKVAGGKKGL